MRICIQYCKNCGAEYKWQASGSNWEVDRTYNDHEYCPECKKAIIEALVKIPKKSELKWILTDLIDFDTLLEWEKLENQEVQERYEEKLKTEEIVLPPMKRVFASLWDTETNQHSRSFMVKGREEHKNKVFMGFYWPKDEDKEKKITVFIRQDMKGNLIKYEKE